MNCDNNQNNNGCGCNYNLNPAPAPADISMSVCDRNINMLPMLQTYTTKVLKPNLCCKKNILTQQMMSCEGYKYVIKWDFDLNGQTITVPKNCILEFDGGSLKNGTIVGQDTLFINVGDTEIWGDNLTREGTWREKQGCCIPDREYNPEENSGMGRKTLEIKDGSNVLYQSDFDQDHTVYVIANDFVLGEDITVPVGCILDFGGGSISNSENNSYTLSGTSTQIKAAKVSIFTKMLIGGTWNCQYITSSWFSDAENDNVVKQLINLTSDDIQNDVYIEPGTYNVSVSSNEEIVISLKSNTTLYNNGTIHLAPNSFDHYYIVATVGKKNVNIIGGSIVGDKAEHDYETNGIALGPKVLSTDAYNTPVGYDLYVNGEYIHGELAASASIVGNVYWIEKDSHGGSDRYVYVKAVEVLSDGITSYVFRIVNTHEWGHGILLRGVSEVTIENVNVSDCCGDCVLIGHSNNIQSENVIIRNFTLNEGRRQGISIGHSKNVLIENGLIGEVYGTDPQYGIDIEPDAYHHADSIIIRNVCIENKKGIGGIQTVAMDTDAHITNVAIENCHTRSMDGIASLGNVAGLRISNNRIESAPGGMAIFINGIGFTPDGATIIENNYISDTATSSYHKVSPANYLLYLVDTYTSFTRTCCFINNKVYCSHAEYVFTQCGLLRAENNIINGSGILMDPTSNIENIIFKNNRINVGAFNINAAKFYNNIIETDLFANWCYPTGVLRINEDGSDFISNTVTTKLVRLRFANPNGNPIKFSGNKITVNLEEISGDVPYVPTCMIYSERALYLTDNYFLFNKTKETAKTYKAELPDRGFLVYVTNKDSVVLHNTFINITNPNPPREEGEPNPFAPADPEHPDVTVANRFIGMLNTAAGACCEHNNVDATLYTDESMYNSIAVFSALPSGCLQGTSGYRPSDTGSLVEGCRFYDTTIGKPIYWKGPDAEDWVEEDGAAAGVARQGVTVNRPTGSDIYVGFMYFDITLGKPIYASAINGETVTWKNAAGEDPDAVIESPDANV